MLVSDRIELRPVAASDAPFLQTLNSNEQILKALAGTDTDVSFWEETIVAWQSDADEQAYLLLDRATDDQIGWCAVNGLSGTDGIVYLKVVAILPEYCGKGIGQECIGMLFDRYCSRQSTRMRLWVDSGNERAIGCYSNAGFCPIRSDVRKVGVCLQARHQNLMEKVRG